MDKECGKHWFSHFNFVHKIFFETVLLMTSDLNDGLFAGGDRWTGFEIIF